MPNGPVMLREMNQSQSHRQHNPDDTGDNQGFYRIANVTSPCVLISSAMVALIVTIESIAAPRHNGH